MSSKGYFQVNICCITNIHQREQFVALHSEPILDDLSNFLADKYSFTLSDLTGKETFAELSKVKLNKVLRQVPKKGDFDIKQVLNSVYFFS
nr:unnamed protein product [Callosobruchus analis]